MTEILKNPKQIAALHDKTRFKFLLCGRRSGKTYLIKEDICKKIVTAPPFGEVVYLAPSHSQAKEIIWDELEQRLYELGWSYNSFPSKNRFELSKKRKIIVLGAEKISRLRGHKLWYAYLDEVAFFGTPLNEVWRVVRPCLSDYGGGAIMSTTPNGKGTDAHEFYQSILLKDDWAYHHWTSLANPYLSRFEIEDAKRELDEKSFRQEYEAEWESFIGLCYYNFDPRIHVEKQPPFNFHLPLHFVMDFNISPCTLLVSQYEDGKMRYKKEYSFDNTSTEQVTEMFCEDFKHQKANINILIRGDASGKNRTSQTGRSDYDYICEILTSYGFRWEKQLLSHNPPIVDRIRKVTSWLINFNKVPRISVDPACSALIKDLSSQELKAGRFPDDAGGKIGHASDALGYDIYYEDRIQKITPVASRIL
jgi:hypothetical protein